MRFGTCGAQNAGITTTDSASARRERSAAASSGGPFLRFSASALVAAWHCRLFRAFRYKTSSHKEAIPVRTLVIALLSAVVVAPLGAAAATCTRHGGELQVLGSGGPEL